MTNKEQIILYFYKKKLNIISISNKLNVSKQYVSKVIKTDPRYINEKERRKEVNKKNRNKKKVIWNRNKREKIRTARLDGIMEMQHIQASIELSGRKTINNRAFKKWNSSIYGFNDRTKEFRIKEDMKDKVSYAVPKKIKWD